MSYENRFVVDLFVKLSPFLDRTADNHVLTDQPQEGDSIPDLSLLLIGVPEFLRIEAKWIEQKIATNVTLTKKQIRSWQLPPSSKNKTPHLWAAMRPNPKALFLATHHQMTDILRKANDQIGPYEKGEDRYWSIALPCSPLSEPEFWRDFWTFVATFKPT